MSLSKSIVSVVIGLALSLSSGIARGQGSLPSGDIPGNFLQGTWTGAETAYSAVQNQIAAAMARVFENRADVASLPQIRTLGRVDIQTEFLDAQADFIAAFWARYFSLFTNFADSVDDDQLIDFGLLSDPITDRLRAIRNTGRTQFTTYAATPRASANLVTGLRGTYDVLRVLPNGRMSPTLGTVTFNADFTVTGSINMMRLIRQLPAAQRASVDALFQDSETLRAVRWFATGGRVFVVGPDFSVSAPANRNTAFFMVTGLDLFPESANVIADSTLNDAPLNAVRAGLTAARTTMRSWTFYFIEAAQ